MKKLFVMTLILCILTVFSLAACGKGSTDVEVSILSVDNVISDDDDQSSDKIEKNEIGNEISDKTNDTSGVADAGENKTGQNTSASASSSQQKSQESAGMEKQVTSESSASNGSTSASEKKEPSKEEAQSFVGKDISLLISAIGDPLSKSYASSCMGDGEDGELHYNGFTVYTYKEGSSERVTDVE